MAIILKNAPKTEEGRKLNLSKEDEEKYRIVFNINKDSKRLELFCVWNPEVNYDNDYVIVPLTSTYDGVDLFEKGKKVQNVKSSSNDPNPYGNNWLGVIKLVYAVKGYTERTDICCLNNYYYDFDNNEHMLNSHNNRNIYGGHMIVAKNQGDNELRPGNTFYLLHICSGHNNRNYDDYYFKTAMDTYVVIMSGFLQEEQIYKAILDFATTIKSNENAEFDV